MSPECQGCGAHVTAQFVRVFSVDGEVGACHECSSFLDIVEEMRRSDGDGH